MGTCLTRAFRATSVRPLPDYRPVGLGHCFIDRLFKSVDNLVHVFSSSEFVLGVAAKRKGYSATLLKASKRGKDRIIEAEVSFLPC